MPDPIAPPMTAAIGRLLLVSPSSETDRVGGRAMLSDLNRAILADLLGDRLTRFDLVAKRPTAREALRGRIDGLDDSTIEALCTRIERDRIDHVFLDGSNLGAAARAIRRSHPGIRILTFLHNVETRFFLGALRARPSAHALAVLIANSIAERAAVRASDTLICLSARDSRVLRRLHGRAANAIAPLAIRDHPPAEPRPAQDGDRFALFVGGGFHGNLDGIRWFARAVAPRTRMKVAVIGRGLDMLTAELADHPSICLIGPVDDLAPWYRDAHVVIAPILSGSGMKTKVAEALMYGKRVIGTPEAFSGYDAEASAAGWLCRDAQGFALALDEAAARPLPAFDPALRALYDRLYSFAAARARMAHILGLPASSTTGA